MTPIPKKYSKLKTSGLEGTIAPDDEAFEVKLLSKIGGDALIVRDQVFLVLRLKLKGHLT